MRVDQSLRYSVFLVYYVNYLWDFEELDSEDALEGAYAMFLKLEEALKQPPYANNGHFGDCTKAPISCLRCEWEELENKVNNAFKFLKGKEEDAS